MTLKEQKEFWRKIQFSKPEDYGDLPFDVIQPWALSVDHANHEVGEPIRVHYDNTLESLVLNYKELSTDAQQKVFEVLRNDGLIRQ